MKQEDTKQRILEKSLELFASKGYDAVSVGEIAKAVGVKAPSLYNHCASKQAIFDAIVESTAAHYEKDTGEISIHVQDVKQDFALFTHISEDADFVVFSNYCLIGTRHMFVRFLWMLQTVKYPQRSKLPTFHTLSKVLKLHMSFNTVPILWLEGRAGMVRAS